MLRTLGVQVVQANFDVNPSFHLETQESPFNQHAVLVGLPGAFPTKNVSGMCSFFYDLTICSFLL